MCRLSYTQRMRGDGAWGVGYGQGLLRVRVCIWGEEKFGTRSWDGGINTVSVLRVTELDTYDDGNGKHVMCISLHRCACTHMLSLCPGWTELDGT